MATIVWNRIARKYKTRFVNDPLRIYHTESDSITATAAAAGRNAYSYLLGNRIKLTEDIDYLRHSPGGFLRLAANYVRFSLHLGESPADMLASLENFRSRLLCLAAFPLGYGVYARDVMRARRVARRQEGDHRLPRPPRAPGSSGTRIIKR